MKKLIIAFVFTAATAVFSADVPEVISVNMSQAQDRTVTITYTLTNAPAVVTLDVQTNCTVDGVTKWASIGGVGICNASGDVWKKVTSSSADGTFNGTIEWHPDLSWPDHKIPDGGARAVVTAWTLENTPDYMVVDISEAATPNSQKYYPGADFVPGGVVSNTEYRLTSLLMRKIMAKDLTWTMGSTAYETDRTAAREKTHKVTLTNNYYIGVFEITQTQWAMIQTARPYPSHFNWHPVDKLMRPVEQVSYNEIRNAANSNIADPTYDWPKDPNPESFLGLLRTKTGIDFDLPSETQWEFAARAGNGDTKWGDGSRVLNTVEDANLGRLARYQRNGGQVINSNGGYSNPPRDCSAEYGPAIVGSYEPNDWGLYDMHGNMWEWCLDWYTEDITSYGGQVNINPANPSLTLSGAAGTYRVLRGGGWGSAAGNCRSAFRNYLPTPDSRNILGGFRVTCRAGLK